MRTKSIGELSQEKFKLKQMLRVYWGIFIAAKPIER